MQVETNEVNLTEVLTKIQRQPDLLEIVRYPNEILNTQSRLVTNDFAKIDDFQQLIADMEKTIISYGALGLSAIQVGVNIQLIIVRDNKRFYRMINPVITKVSKEIDFSKEGCLSFPGVHMRVRRPNFLEVKYLDENGQAQSLMATGVLARAISHEVDHIHGTLFISHMNMVQKEKTLKLLKKFK